MPQITEESFTRVMGSNNSRQQSEMNDPTRVYYTLVCIKDGSEHVFFDDGPFPLDPVTKLPLNGWMNIAPSGRRQNLLAQLRKHDKDGFPIWASRTRVPGVWDRNMQRPLDVHVIDDAWLAQSAKHLSVRDSIANEVKAKRKAKASEEEQAGSLSEAKLANAMASVMERALSGVAPAAKAKAKGAEVQP